LYAISVYSIYRIYKKTSIAELHKEYLTDSVKIKLPSVDIIHLRIFAESFVKFVQKLSEIYGKTNESLFSKHVYITTGFSLIWKIVGKAVA